MRLLTWNVNGRRRQLCEQVDAIAGQSPDIVALQEVTAGTVGLLRSALAEHGLSNVIDSFADSPSWTATGPRRYGVLLANQANTLNLNRLLREIIADPQVITGARRLAIHGEPQSELLGQLLDRQFTASWVRQPNHADAGLEHVDPAVVQADLDALHTATERVSQVASRAIAHRQRVQPGQVTYGEIDAAFKAIEEALQKYYALICSPALVSAEPAPQFNTRDVFTFPWIETPGAYEIVRTESRRGHREPRWRRVTRDFRARASVRQTRSFAYRRNPGGSLERRAGKRGRLRPIRPQKRGLAQSPVPLKSRRIGADT